MRAETRHQLKQDAFSRVTIDAAERTAHWSVEHRTTLIISVVAVAIVLAAVIGGWYYLSAQDEKASFDLSGPSAPWTRSCAPPALPNSPTSRPSLPPKSAPRPPQKKFQAIVESILTPAPPTWRTIFWA